jgi:tryptophan-rich sensory protein
MFWCRRHSRIAPLLLLPYLLWVTLAGVLNLAVVRLNGPFG